MNKKFWLPGLLIFGISSCGLLDELIPDVDTEYVQSYTIPIVDNYGTTDPELVDVASSPEFSEFEDNIDAFEVNEISVYVVSFDGPVDMYFSGQILAMDTLMNDTVVVGDISMANLSEMALADTTIAVEELISGTDQVEAWLEGPGKFYGYTSYVLTDSLGSPYPIGDAEYNLGIDLEYSVTVITVADSGSSDEE